MKGGSFTAFFLNGCSRACYLQIKPKGVTVSLFCWREYRTWSLWRVWAVSLYDL